MAIRQEFIENTSCRTDLCQFAIWSQEVNGWSTLCYGYTCRSYGSSSYLIVFHHSFIIDIGIMCHHRRWRSNTITTTFIGLFEFSISITFNCISYSFWLYQINATLYLLDTSTWFESQQTSLSMATQCNEYNSCRRWYCRYQLFSSDIIATN